MSDPWSIPALASARQRSDPVADTVIDDLFRDREVDDANRILRGVPYNAAPLPPGLPEPLPGYFAETAVLPAWADPDRLRLAQGLFARHGPSMLLSLVCASLPECYRMRHGVKVLFLSHRMAGSQVTRRVLETAQFVVDVLAPGGFESNGRAIRAAQRVRLMHAAMRHLLLRTPTGREDHSFAGVFAGTLWDSAADGLPVCQEDLAFTLTTFSHVTLRSLDIAGVDMKPGEADAFAHLWGVVGHLMGLEDALIPRDAAACQLLYERIVAHQAGPSQEGQALAAVLPGFVGQYLDWPWLGRHIATMLTRGWVSDQACVELAIRPLRWWEKPVLRLLRGAFDKVSDGLDKAGSHWSGVGHLRNAAALALVRGFTRIPRAWQRGLFSIPESLTTGWKT